MNIAQLAADNFKEFLLSDLFRYLFSVFVDVPYEARVVF